MWSMPFLKVSKQADTAAGTVVTGVEEDYAALPHQPTHATSTSTALINYSISG